MRIIYRVAAGIAIAVVLVYAADAAWVRLRMANHQDPTSAIQVRVMLAVPQKNGRIEFTPGNTETQSCVRSWFPHLGLEPCWYVERHTRKQVDF
jgi:hypothetical protein